MRLSFVSHEYPPFGGGAATALESFSKHLSLKGHNVQVITINPTNKSIYDKISSQYEIVRLPAGRNTMLAPSMHELIKSYHVLKVRAPSLLNNFKPDAIICFFSFPAGYAITDYAKLKKLPLIVSIRGSDAPGFWSDRPRWMLKILNKLTIKTLAQADGVFCNGHHLTGLVRPYVQENRLLCLANGVDIERFYPDNSRHNNITDLNLLFIGQFIKRKGCLELVRAFNRVINKGYKDITLTLAGSGPLEQALHKLADQSINPHFIKVISPISRLKISNLYWEHNALTLFSKGEGVSNVVLEAIASGLPVLSCQTAIDSCIDTEPILMAKDYSEMSIFKLINSLADKPGTLLPYREAAKKHSNTLGWDMRCNKFETWLNNIISI